MQERRSDDVVARAVFGDQKSDREKVGDVWQWFCFLAHLSMVLSCGKLYRFLYLRCVVHVRQSIT